MTDTAPRAYLGASWRSRSSQIGRVRTTTRERLLAFVVNVRTRTLRQTEPRPRDGPPCRPARWLDAFRRRRARAAASPAAVRGVHAYRTSVDCGRD